MSIVKLRILRFCTSLHHPVVQKTFAPSIRSHEWHIPQLPSLLFARLQLPFQHGLNLAGILPPLFIFRELRIPTTCLDLIHLLLDVGSRASYLASIVVDHLGEDCWWHGVQIVSGLFLGFHAFLLSK